MSFYDDNASTFFANTAHLDMSEHYAPFFSRLNDRACLLDAGCGSGRDALFFRNQGYTVTAIDASPSMCTLASTHTGLEVQCMPMQDITFKDCFDGVWACASLLHVPEIEMVAVLERLKQSLKKDGVLYASYRLGTGQRVDNNGRLFTNATDDIARSWLVAAGLRPIEFWTTIDVRPDKQEIKWLNLIAQRSSHCP
jgi:SAM-dependent methyltransferase